MTATEMTRPAIPEACLREIEDKTLAHRGALEEITGLSKKSVDRLAGREDFPAPVIERGPERRSWYDPDALIDFALSYERHEVGVDAELAAATPRSKLLTPTEAAELMRISPATFRKNVEQSIPAWNRGEDGYLPRPDEEQPRGTKQVSRRWKAGTIIDHQARRQGHGGRPPAHQ